MFVCQLYLRDVFYLTNVGNFDIPVNIIFARSNRNAINQTRMWKFGCCFFSLGFMDVGHGGHVYGSWGCRPVSSGGWGWNYCYCCFLSECLLSTVSNEAMQVKSCWMRSPWRGGWGHTSRQGGGCVGVGPRILPNGAREHHVWASPAGWSGAPNSCAIPLYFPPKETYMQPAICAC